MEQINKVKYITITSVLMILCFTLGFFTSGKISENNSEAVYNDFSQNKISSIIEQLEEGDSVVFSMEEINTPESSYTNAGNKDISIKSTKGYTRIFSWFGLGGPEAMAKDQGFNIKVGGEEAVFAQQKGYGILEQLWSRIKSLFWVLTFGVLAIFLLSFAPVVGPIFSGILRFIGSAIPFLGSLVERIFSYFKAEKPLKQVVKGVQDYKDKLPTEEKEALKDSLIKAQDEGSKKIVKKVKKTL